MKKTLSKVTVAVAALLIAGHIVRKRNVEQHWDLEIKSHNKLEDNGNIRTDISVVEKSETATQVTGSDTETPTHSYMPNHQYKHGMIPLEFGKLSFLNRSIDLIHKPLRKDVEVGELKKLILNPENIQIITKHYQNEIPGKFNFAEELSRIKMVEFLSASIEMTEELEQSKLDEAIDAVLMKDLQTISDKEVRRSVAGDVVQLLKILRTKSPSRFVSAKSKMIQKSINTKLIDYSI